MTGSDLAGADWRKSSRSGSQGGDCVEVAALARMVALRDSKDPAGPVLRLSSGGWAALLNEIKTGLH